MSFRRNTGYDPPLLTHPFTREQVADAARNVSERAWSTAEEPDVVDLPFDRDTLLILAQAFEWFAREIEAGTT